MTYDPSLRSLEPHHHSSQFFTNSHYAPTDRGSRYDLASVTDDSMGSTLVCDDEELLYTGRNPTPRLTPSVAGEGTCDDDFRYYYIHTPCEGSKLLLELDIRGDIRRNRTDSEHCFKEEALIKSSIAAWGYAKKNNGDLSVVLTMPCSGGVGRPCSTMDDVTLTRQRSVRSEEAVRHNRCNLPIKTRTYDGKVDTDAVINSLDANNLSVLLMNPAVSREQAKSIDPLSSEQKRDLASKLSKAEINLTIFGHFRDKRESSIAALETQIRKIKGIATDIAPKRKNLATVWVNVAHGSLTALDGDAGEAVTDMWGELAATWFNLYNHQTELLPKHCDAVAATLKTFENTPSKRSFFDACDALKEAVSSMSECVDDFNLDGLRKSESRLEKWSICPGSDSEAYTDIRETIDTNFQPLVKQVFEVQSMTKNLVKDTQDSLRSLRSNGALISRACPSW